MTDIEAVANTLVQETGSFCKYTLASGCRYVEEGKYVTTINQTKPNNSEFSWLNLGRKEKFICDQIMTCNVMESLDTCKVCKGNPDNLRLIQTPEAKRVENWNYYHRSTGDIEECGSGYVNGEWEKWYTIPPGNRLTFC